MKNKFSRIISAILILTFLVSAFAVFASASEDGTGGSGEENEINLLLNRSFDEGWEFDNGLTNNAANNNFFVDHEEDSQYNYNYFFRLETSDGSNAYARFVNTGSNAVREGQTVIELSLKLDDYADIGTILQMHTDIKNKIIPVLSIKKNRLYFFDVTDNKKSVALDNNWVEVALIINWDPADFTCTVKYNKVDPNDETEVALDTDGDGFVYSFDYKKAYEVAEDDGMKEFRLGFPAISGAPTSLAERIGMSYCVDNLKIYNGKGLTNVVDVEPDDYGANVQLDKEKTVNILSGSGLKSSAQLLAEALCLKVGVDYQLARNKKEAIFDGTYGAPAIIDGHVMIPLDTVLRYIGFPSFPHPDNVSFDITTGTSVTYLTIGRNEAKVGEEIVQLSVAPLYLFDKDGNNPYPAIAVDDFEAIFPGWLITYDEMGLIVIYEDTTPDNKEDNDEIVNRDQNLESMVDIMKKFIFETAEGDDAESTYVNTGMLVYNDAKEYTNNFSHPYLLTNQDTFDALKAAYNLGKDDAGFDERLNGYLKYLVASAMTSYKKYAKIDADGSYIGLDFIPVNPYTDGLNPDPDDKNDKTIADTTDGYDPDGGRLNETGTYTSFLPSIAFAYQITGDENLLEFAYDWMLAFAQWEHWGPGHFLNCAEAVSSYSIAYDWLYNGFEAAGMNHTILAKAIFDLGIHDGYISSSGKTLEHPRALGDGSHYNTATSNWNAVCTAGMVIGSLAIFGLVDDENYTTQFNETVYLVGNNMINLPKYGLDEYAPDGSYIESASYWAYGTNNFFRLVMALNSSTGKDYGFMDTWGMDRTCYYACQIVSSDGRMWNYHDGGGDGVTSSSGLGRCDSSYFNFVGHYLGDPGLVALRLSHLDSKFANVGIYDVLYYPKDGVPESVELPLDYLMEGIDAFVARDSWEKGALYTGLMGGLNDCAHGQIDSGNFIYHNKGIVWFMDLGSEQYNAYQYFGASRYKYYRATSEGQNVMVMTSQPGSIAYGQYSGAGGDIIASYSNEHGSYAILDNKAVYLDTLFYARRGILVTNDRQTVVIQDEISVVKQETFVWVAHTAENIVVDDSGRTAFLTATDSSGEQYTLRATLLADIRKLKFEVINTTDSFLLDGTNPPSYSTSKGGVPEYPRNGLQRLIVRCTNTGGLLNIAVVLEMVDSMSTTAPVGYEWQDMFRWEPTAPPEAGEIVAVRDAAVRADINSKNAILKTIFKKADTAFTTNLETLYAALTTVAYTFKTYLPENIPELVDPFIEHEEHKEEYENYMEYVERVVGNIDNLAQALVGFEVETAPAE